MKTVVIILHFGTLSVTKACVESLYTVEKSEFSTIIVNNASEKISINDFSKRPDLVVINNDHNIGFAAGVNVGIRYALSHGAKVIILLNNDTVLTKPIITGLTNDLSHYKEVGIVAPAIHFKRNNISIYDLGGKINKWFGRTTHQEVTHIRYNAFRFVTYVSGCCMAIKTDVIKRVGLFDEKYFLYYEDADFCLRAKRAGYIIAVDPRFVVDHALSKSAGHLSSVSTFHQIRSARVFGEKYFVSGIPLVLQRLFIFYQTMVFVIKSHNVSSVKAFFSKI